jgi:hypothetical protein
VHKDPRKNGVILMMEKNQRFRFVIQEHDLESKLATIMLTQQIIVTPQETS